MSDKSLPDDSDIEHGGDLEESLPPENNQSTADDDKDAVSSDDSQDADQDSKDEPQEGSPRTEDDDSDAEDGLAKFAKSRGYDFEELTDREKQLLKDVRENQKKARSKTADDLRDATKEANTVDDKQLEEVDEYEAREIQREARLAQLEANQKVTDFYNRNPEAKDYDTAMGKLITQEKEKHGETAARYLANDLDRLLVLAKASSGDNDSDVIRDKAKREERESLRKRQEGSADTSHATSRSTGNAKVTREWINEEYDPGNKEHVQMVDEAIARGDLY